MVVADTPGSVYVWTGANISGEAKGSATAQATELIAQFTENENISIKFEEQAKESEDFAALFPSLAYVTPEAAAGAAEEGAESDGPAEEAAGGDQAGGKKKKKKKKGKGAAAAGATEVPGESEAAEIEQEADGEAAPAPAEEEKPVEEEKAVEEEEHKALSDIAGAPTPTAEQAALVAELEENLPEIVDDAQEDEITPEEQGEDVSPAKPIIKATSTTDLNANLSPVVSSKSYVADSAKAWGGAGTPGVAVEVKVPIGEKYYPYEELKGKKTLFIYEDIFKPTKIYDCSDTYFY